MELTINTEEAKKRIKTLQNTIMYDLMTETMKLTPKNTGNLRRYDGEYMRIIKRRPVKGDAKSGQD